MPIGLQVLLGRERGRAYIIDDGQFMTGRADECDLVLPSDLVSRAHARFVVTSTTLKIVDMKSSNGSYINGARILGEGQASAGEIVLIGDVAMRVYEGEDPPPLDDSVFVREDASPGAEKSANLCGSLSEVPPATVLRYLAVIKKTGVLVMSSPPTQARVSYNRGHISEVSVSGKKSRDPIQALTAILRWRGTFEIEPLGDGPTSSLLLGLDTVLPPIGTASRPSMMPPAK